VVFTPENGRDVLDLQKIKRGVLKTLLSPWLQWSADFVPREGFSIILGVPWPLRHLLSVNLYFVSKTDLSQLYRIYIVFDRPAQDGGDAFIAHIRASFPELPLTFSFHPPVAGAIVENINQSKFYASTNWTLGLGLCETRYAVLHDFDLYPLIPHYFTSMFEAMRDRKLRFTGVEWASYDGLEPSHALVGTWALGIDVAWLRQNYRPIDCFHTVGEIGGRRFDLDAFSFLQSKTPERALVDGVTGKDMAHVRNLCSTYLRFSKGERADLVWRLHQMWYLESLHASQSRLPGLVNLMDTASSPLLEVDGHIADFTSTHVTSANVLRSELTAMEKFLFGGMRPEIVAYVDAFERFLWRYSRTDTITDPDGAVRWSADLAPNRPASLNQN